MKNLLILFFLLPSMASAQNFEGIVTWKINSEITDPKLKAQMEEAKKRMEDPAVQAQMKEMKEKMNDPQFKAMMDANPQLKTQLEASMKMAETSDMASMAPKGHILKIKDQNYLSRMEGGIIGDYAFLYVGDKNISYRLNMKDKTYSEIKPDPAAKKPEVKVTKTGETAKILNYNCVKYIAEIATDGHTVVQNIWTTDEIKGIDLKKVAQQRMTSGQEYIIFDQIDGFPLKVQMKLAQANTSMEVTEIKRQSLPSSDFVIPAGFREVEQK